MKVEGVDNEIAGNSLRARSKERKIDRALALVLSDCKKADMIPSHISSKSIGATGFEPATSRPPAERATKLRHTPIEL